MKTPLFFKVVIAWIITALIYTIAFSIAAIQIAIEFFENKLK